MKKLKDDNPEEIVNPIEKECKKYEKQINEIQQALESVKLAEIEETNARLKATDTKVDIMQKLPKLLLALKQLKEEAVKSVGEVRGQQQLSEIETGEI